MEYQPIIIKLINLINTQSEWYNLFDEAWNSIIKYQLDEFLLIYSLDDFILWCNDLLTWPPIENDEHTNIDYKLTVIYFFFNQLRLKLLPNRNLLLSWMIEYVKELGIFYDSTQSLTSKSLQTLYNIPEYRLDEYMQDPSGWKTFNQFFARRIKPGYRPIDHLCNNNVIVSVADSTYKGSLAITPHSQITVKQISWSISELLNNNPYSHYFKNGTFIHAFLSPYDYHRLHMPLSGQVLYTEIVSGNVYLETYVIKKKLATRRSNYVIKIGDTIGYEFTQARGVIILNTDSGIIAIIPVGMSFISSIVITAEVGRTLNKGDEFGYFQFGGSDYIMLFPDNMRVNMTAKMSTHYNQGTQIGYIKQ